jgi:hypothetical protein
MTNIYYVYAYLRSKDSTTAKSGTPYYIGKGKGRRAWERHRSTLTVPHNNDCIVILESGLTEIGALAIERRLINWWGRKDTGTGILLNRSDGGDGARQGPITCAKMSIKAKMRSTPEKMKALGKMTEAKREKLRVASIANGSIPPSQKGKTYWTNGIKNAMSFTSPGPDWYPGRVRIR